jgi:hypothetical protein
MQAATILASGVGEPGKTAMGRGGWGRVAAALLAVLALAPWLILAFRSRASADDFCFITLVRSHGWLGAQLAYYQTVSGRYSSTAAITAIGWLTDRLGSGPSGLYVAIAWPIILAILVFAWRSVGLLLPDLSAADRRIVACFVGVAFLATLPSAADVVYWATSASIYMSSLLLVWHFMLQLIATATDQPPPPPAGMVGLGCLALLGAGLNEMTAPLLILVIATWGYVGYRRGWPARRLAGLAAIAGIALLAFVIIVDAAPGNDLRLAAYPGSRDLATGLPWSLVDAATFLLLRVAALPALIGLLGLAWLQAASRAAPPEYLPPLWLMPALLLASCLLAFAISRYSMAHGLPHRAQDLLYVFPFVALGATAVWHGRTSGSRLWSGWTERQRRLATGAAILLCLAGPTEWRAFYEAFWSGPRFAAENDRRLEMLATDTAADATVPLLATRPKLLFIADLKADPKDWYNQCVAAYSGHRSVTAQ